MVGSDSNKYYISIGGSKINNKAINQSSIHQLIIFQFVYLIHRCNRLHRLWPRLAHPGQSLPVGLCWRWSLFQWHFLLRSESKWIHRMPNSLLNQWRNSNPISLRFHLFSILSTPDPPPTSFLFEIIISSFQHSTKIPSFLFHYILLCTIFMLNDFVFNFHHIKVDAFEKDFIKYIGILQHEKGGIEFDYK